ncbi:host specificity factor TipJ family phage tail protein [Microbaculum marinum]|uniref:Host specificity factor TipJ family phage tail protein n=1 Tax=Microbaculum marinum TaxID=1764581 RepID=A0AAW9RQJ7_9HYPH
MCRAVVIDRFYEEAEREIVLDRPGMTVHEALAQVARDYPQFFTEQDPEKPLPVFPQGKRFRVPTAVIGCMDDGDIGYVRQSTWHTRTVGEGETLALVAMPRGGGSKSQAGKQVISVVALLALTIAAPYLIAGLGFSALGTTAATLTFAGRLAASALTVGGGALLSLLAPKPETPPTEDFQVYTAAAANNRISPLGVIPVWYGRNRLPPPFATRSYAEFEGNDQLLYQVLLTTCGKLEREKIEFGDTEVWNADDGYTGNIDGIEFEFIEPGGQITLFPAGVVTASEIGSGLDVQDPPDELGPFVVNAAGEDNRIDKIAVDLLFPEGLYFEGDDGSITQFGAAIKAEYREIDDDGDPVGSWKVLIGDETINGINGGKVYQNATKEPQRVTEKVAVPKGRYEVKLYATFPFQPPGENGHNKTIWSGLKGYLADFTTPDGVSLIAVKIRANEDFSQLSANEIFVTGTRMLPIYDPETQTWSEPTATRSIAWAAADLLRNTDYGAGLADTVFDLDWLAAYAPFWEGRGDTFNGVFDRAWILGDAVNAILDTGNAQTVRLGGKLGFVRDEARDLRRATFTPRNIVKGTFWHEFIFADDESPDCLWVQFINEATWQPDEVKAAIASYGSQAPVDQNAFGITDRDHAWRWGIRKAAENAYRREVIGFMTEAEGLDLARLDPVNVAHPLMGVAGAALVEEDEGVLLLDSDVVQSPTPQYFTQNLIDWTSSNAGSAGTVGTLSGAVVDDPELGGLALLKSGTGTNAIRLKNLIDAPQDGEIVELQVRWRVSGSGEGRIRARCISLDGNYGQIGSTAGDYTDLHDSSDGVITSKFYFAAAADTGISAWESAAKALRFGINVNAGAGGAQVRVQQVRTRIVWGLEDSVYLRSKTGQEWGPCLVAAIPDDFTIELDAADFSATEGVHGALGDQLPDDREEPAHLILLQDGAPPFDGLVIAARPAGKNRVEVLAVRDAPEVYTADGTETIPPYLPKPRPPKVPDRPVVLGLTAHLERTDFSIMLHAGWQPAPGAKRYVAHVSFDGEVTWERVYSGDDNRFSTVVKAQALKLRVRAIGKFRGPPAYFTIGPENVPPVEPPPGSIDIEHLDADLRKLQLQLKADAQAFLADKIQQLSEVQDRIAAAVAEALALTKNSEAKVLGYLDKSNKSARASVSTLQVVIAEANLALAAQITQVDASLTDLEGLVDANTSGLAALIGRVEITEHDIDAIFTALVSIGAEIEDLETGTSALADAVDLIEARVSQNEDALEISAMMARILNATLSQFIPNAAWTEYAVLSANATGFNGATLSTAAAGRNLRIQGNGSSGNPGVRWTLPVADRFSGNTNKAVRVVGQFRTKGDQPFLGRLRYSVDGGHGYSSSFQQFAPNPVDPGGSGVALNTYITFTFDMSGIADWTSSTITGLEFVPSSDVSADFELVSIAWGNETPALTATWFEINSAEIVQTKDNLALTASSVEGIQLALPGIEHDASAALSIVSALEGTVYANQHEIGVLGSAVTAIQGQITGLDHDTAALFTLYTALDGSVVHTDNETEVNAFLDQLLNAEITQFLSKGGFEGYNQVREFATGINGATLSAGTNDNLRMQGNGSSANPGIRWTLDGDHEFNGGQNRAVRIVGQFRSPGDQPFVGRLFYSTGGGGGHGFEAGHYVDAPNPVDPGGTDIETGKYIVLEFDCSGIADWTSSTITGLQLRPTSDVDGHFEVASVQWGNNTPAIMASWMETNSAQVRQTKDGISALATAMQGVLIQDEFGNFASAYLAFEVSGSGPDDWDSTISLVSRAGLGDSFEEAAFTLATETGVGGGVLITAESLEFRDNSGNNPTVPMYYSGGQFWFDEVNIRLLNAGNMADFATAAWASDTISSPVSVPTGFTFEVAASVDDVPHNGDSQLAEVRGMVDLHTAASGAGIAIWTIQVRKGTTVLASFEQYVYSGGTGSIRTIVMVGAVDGSPGATPDYDIRVSHQGGIAGPTSSVEGGYMIVQGWKK